MGEVTLKAGECRKSYDKHFTRLMEISAPKYFPALFGPKFREVFQRLFIEKANLFSHEHVVFAIYCERIAGMLLSYDWKAKEKEEKRTGWLMLKVLGLDFLKHLPAFIKGSSGLGETGKGGLLHQQHRRLS